MILPFQDGWTMEEMEAAVQRNTPEELLYIPVWVSMDPPDCGWAEDLCICLSSHPHFNVRGNAILGFGHLARTCRKLGRDVVQPIIEDALFDESEYVRDHAKAAAEDIAHYLKWDDFGEYNR